MELPKRKRVRLPEYDYGQAGCYFITICTKDRRCLFWESVGADTIRPERPPLSICGAEAERAILNIPFCYPWVTLHKWVIMPNHVHLLLQIAEAEGRILFAPTRSVSTIVGQMKRAVSKALGKSAWQKGFYDHVIRDENDFLRIWTYIDTNPAKWAEDRYDGRESA